MKFLRRLFGKQAPASTPIDPHRPAESSSPASSPLALLFLFDALPELQAGPLSEGVAASGALAAPLRIFDEVSTDSGQYAHIAFDNHRFRWFGISAPAPEDSTQQPISCSHWRQEDKVPLREHQAHAICWYEGAATDPSEQMIALLRLAGAFSRSGLVGVVDTDAWNCMPVSVLVQMLEPGMLATCRQEVPVGLWTGFVKLFKSDDEVWFCTKGFHRWGIRDFAFFGAHHEADHISGLFAGLFHYLLRSGARLEAGHTAQFGGHFLRFGPVTEYADYIQGPLGTLVIEKTQASEPPASR